MHLARHGFQVEVICGREQYLPPQEAPESDPRQEGVSIRYIPKIIGGNFRRWRFLRQLWFCTAAIPLLLLRRSPDLLATMTNPPLIVPIVAVAAWLHRRPFVVVAQDLYPEVLIAHGLLRPGSLVGKLLTRLFARAYAAAERVVSLGPKMSQRLVRKGVSTERIVLISNWSTGGRDLVRGAENEVRRELSLGDCFVVLYSGNLGLCHDLETPVRAMQELATDLPGLRLLFVGQGGRLDETKRLVASLGLTASVRFEPYASSSRLRHTFGTADLALVTLRDGFEGLNVPSKTIGYLARGIPILYVGPDSDVSRLVETAGAGFCIENGDASGFAAVLRRAVVDPELLARMGRSGRRHYDEKLERSLALQCYRQLFATVTSAHSTPAPERMG